jgi:hypothetical protein
MRTKLEIFWTTSMLTSATVFFLSCVTPITEPEWELCKVLCKDEQGILEVCHEAVNGLGCHCRNDVIFWPQQFKIYEPNYLESYDE